MQDAMTLITWIISFCWTYQFGCWIIRWATRDSSVQRTPYDRDDFVDDHSTTSSKPKHNNGFLQTGDSQNIRESIYQSKSQIDYTSIAEYLKLEIEKIHLRLNDFGTLENRVDHIKKYAQDLTNVIDLLQEHARLSNDRVMTWTENQETLENRMNTFENQWSLKVGREQELNERIDQAQELATKSNDLLNCWSGNYEVLKNQLEVVENQLILKRNNEKMLYKQIKHVNNLATKSSDLLKSLDEKYLSLASRVELLEDESSLNDDNVQNLYKRINELHEHTTKASDRVVLCTATCDTLKDRMNNFENQSSLKVESEQKLGERIDLAHELDSKTSHQLNYWVGNFENMENRLVAVENLINENRCKGKFSSPTLQEATVDMSSSEQISSNLLVFEETRVTQSVLPADLLGMMCSDEASEFPSNVCRQRTENRRQLVYSEQKDQSKQNRHGTVLKESVRRR